MAVQLKSINLNIDRDRQSDAQGNDVQQDEFPVVSLSQKNVAFGIDLRSDDGSPVTDLLLANDSFSFAADQDFDDTTIQLLFSDDSQFNIPGDRSDLDIVNGKISVRIDADTAALNTALATDRDLTITGEVKAFNQGETNPKLVAHFFIVTHNLVEGGGTPGPPVSNFYTKAETDALLAAAEAGAIPIESANVDFKTPALIDIGTVSTSRLWGPIWFFERTDNIITPGTPPKIKLVTDDPRDLTNDLQAISNAVNGFSRVLVTDNILVPAGTKIQAEIITGSTATTHNGKFSFTYKEFDA